MIEAPALERVRAARTRTAGIVRHTPTLPLRREHRTLWLKLEVLQPIASFSEQVACIVSGGNIDSAKLARILAGEVP